MLTGALMLLRRKRCSSQSIFLQHPMQHTNLHRHQMRRSRVGPIPILSSGRARRAVRHDPTQQRLGTLLAKVQRLRMFESEHDNQATRVSSPMRIFDRNVPAMPSRLDSKFLADRLDLRAFASPCAFRRNLRRKSIEDYFLTHSIGERKGLPPSIRFGSGLREPKSIRSGRRSVSPTWRSLTLVVRS